jgi:dCTP deaminase
MGGASMILSDASILEEMRKGNIVIKPFELANLGPNSYDVRLSKHVAIHAQTELRADMEPMIHRLEMGDGGYRFIPGTLYLASTLEYTETRGFVPYLDGKSSVGRLGIQVHLTAGRGDSGFCNHWTMEISVVQPVRVFPGMKIAQLTYHAIDGLVERPYDRRVDSKYQHVGGDPLPQPSRMWKNFQQPESKYSAALVQGLEAAKDHFGALSGTPRLDPTCEVCGKPVSQPGVRFCSGLSACWREAVRRGLT